MEVTEGQTHLGQRLDMTTNEGRSGRGGGPNNSAGGGVSGVA